LGPLLDKLSWHNPKFVQDETGLQTYVQVYGSLPRSFGERTLCNTAFKWNLVRKVRDPIAVEA
jgi:hypothetical protein